jgi:N-acetylglutamate synthase-like GNAT family acetyltransferase
MPTIEEFLELDMLGLPEPPELSSEDLSPAQLRKQFEEVFPISQVCTVCRDGRLVAFAMLQPQSPTCWFITCFNIHPRHRTSSVLRELFSEFGALVQRHGIAELRSNVYKTNRLSLSFHKRLGFCVTRENAEAVEMFVSVAEMMASPSIHRTAHRLRRPMPDPRGGEKAS